MKSGERRAAIVVSATRLFAERGFRGTTTRELAAASGVTEPVLYQHFRTKRHLYSAIIEAAAAGVAHETAELRRLAKGTDDQRFFCAVGELILDRYAGSPEMYRLLLFSCLEGHELAELFFERVFLDFFKQVSGYIRRRIRAGAFRKVNAEIASRALIGMIAYHGQMGLLFPGRTGRAGRQRLVEDLVTIFLEGICAPR